MPSVNIDFEEGETCESLGRDGFIETTGVCVTWLFLANKIMLEPIDSGKEATGNCCVEITLDALKKIAKLLEKEEELKKQCSEYVEIGGTIKIKGKTYECIAADTCDNCSFDDTPNICEFMACSSTERSDSTAVIFKQVEK